MIELVRKLENKMATLSLQLLNQPENLMSRLLKSAIVYD